MIFYGFKFVKKYFSLCLLIFVICLSSKITIISTYYVKIKNSPEGYEDVPAGEN